ncbi:TRAP transporter, DctM subunit [Tistlia consotensis]|uniref:TRAP transporter large permease protein n=1 Tax=Tistlia consotensis USBA 355 TaxID=560819 RepID=A0A1Y6C3N1_9PROT|nr:TRAP transporter large permease [Tistlia consotensis]SMF35566.1 TRAP transporter, DctM subunit [Tistlia consotensis USBA 355]SNR70937.1 TRAP transporter, DctM subunit [Tistlia consotensis]
MSPIEIGFLGVGAVLLLMALRLPIGIALAGVSFLGLWAVTNLTAAWGLVRAVPYEFIATWSFSAVPMFLLMGYIASHAGLTSGLFRSMRILLAGVPGGLACATVGACALFAAASGSSVATAAAMARIAVPEMIRHRYDRALATGCVAAAGTLGSLIPPSILMVLYGVFTQQSIGKLFVAGFLPGLLSAVVYMAMIVTRVSITPSLAPRAAAAAAPGELRDALREIWPLPLLILGVLGGIFTGVMTPTEAGAVGAFIAVLIAAVRGRLSRAMLRGALRDTAMGTSVIFVIAMGASMFTTFMGLTRLPTTVAEAMLSVGDDPLLLVVMIGVIFVILGMFIDSIGLMLLTLPIMMPLLDRAGVDMIWFGILVIKLLEIGLVTPPVGLNVYVIKSALGGLVELPTVFRGAAWFIVMDLVTLALLIAFPAISLWLPSLMD